MGFYTLANHYVLVIYQKLVICQWLCSSIVVCNWRRVETITRHSNLYHTTWCWPCWQSWGMWHAELMIRCLLPDPLGPPSNSWWNSMNSRVWTVKYGTLFWDFFHSSHFMRRIVFYVFKCNILYTWIKTLVTMMIEYFVQRWLWKQIDFFRS